MVIDIRLFATLKDRAGQASLSYELGIDATVADLVAGLSEAHPGLAEALPSALVAVNEEFAFAGDPLNDGDRVAFFPPVSGGAKADAPASDGSDGAEETPEFPLILDVTNDPLDVDALVARITLPTTGAVATFIGKVRGMTTQEGETLETSALFYEAYSEMAASKLNQVAGEMRERWPLVEGIALVQRIGHLDVGTTTVFVACSAGHRDQGVFEAARYGIDRIKEIVPVWKKEIGPDGETWVEGHYQPTPEDAPARAPEQTLAEVVVSAEDVPLEGIHYACPDCGERYPLDTSRWRCECGEAFQLQNLPPFDGERVETDVFNMWRYRAMLLPGDVAPVSLGEGWTPLLPARLNGRSVYLKLESQNPTGSFKDRGSAVHVSILRANGVQMVHDDSSGNAGASMAAYAARAGLASRIYVPEGASPAKRAQIKLYGAELVEPGGTRSDVAKAARDAADAGTSHYASHLFNPFTVVGMKTIAYEIWEQMGSRTPDVVVIPVGYGSQLLGVAAGFRDLLDFGAIDRLPRLVGVQAAACAPLWAEFSGYEGEVQENETVAEGVRIIEPLHREAILDVVRASEGTFVAVEEEAILDGMRQLARSGVLVEPTSAVVVPALAQLDDWLAPDASVVLSLTGSGYKSPHLEAEAEKASRVISEPV